MLKSKCKGFTLLELIIVTGIIALIARLAIPQLLRARLNANESAAITTLHSYSFALQGFQAANPPLGFPATLVSLAPLNQPPYIDLILATVAPARHGYSFFYTQVPGVPSIQYHIYAEPQVINSTGIRGFYVDEQGVLSSIPVAAGNPGHSPPGSTVPPGYSEIQ